MSTYYQILGINMRATAEQIRLAYKQKAIEYHPDKHLGSAIHEEQFKKIAEAYRILSDPKKKNVYDMGLFYKSAMSNFSNKNADTTVPPVYRNVPKPTPSGGKGQYFSGSKMGKKQETRLGLQTVSVGLLVFSCLVMIGFWLADLLK